MRKPPKGWNWPVGGTIGVYDRLNDVMVQTVRFDREPERFFRFLKKYNDSDRYYVSLVDYNDNVLVDNGGHQGALRYMSKGTNTRVNPVRGKCALLADIIAKGRPVPIREIQGMARRHGVEEPLSQVIDRWVDENKLEGFERMGRIAFGTPTRPNPGTQERWSKNPADKETWQESEFREGAAKALWATLFSTELYNLEEDGYDDLYQDLRPGEGEDIMDHLPPLPEAALEDAKSFERALLEANKVGNIEDLLNRAAKADGVEEVDAEDFGHYTMMPALGEGVNWFDDHGDFDLHIPHWEQSTDVHNEMFEFLEEKKAEYGYEIEGDDDEEDED